jgi:hypothetical protein
MDSFFFFLHWLRTGNSVETIAAGFHLQPDTLHKRLHEVAAVIHDPLFRMYVTSQASAEGLARQRKRDSIDMEIALGIRAAERSQADELDPGNERRGDECE